MEECEPAKNWDNRIITVHQAGLMVDTQTYQAIITKHCPDNPWRVRLRSSESILLNAARKFGTLQVDLIDRKCNSRLITATQCMLAIVILALSITKEPESKRNRLDTEVRRRIRKSTSFAKDNICFTAAYGHIFSHRRRIQCGWTESRFH